MSKNNKNLNDRDLFDFLITESKVPFSGWDFSYLDFTGRMNSSLLTWNYASKIMANLKDIDSLLDMGTGGGEFLSKIRPLPKETYATECYKPNIPIAKKRLEPLRIKVIGLKNHNKLPFDDNYFDLVINRHDSYEESELLRILKNKCYFITQQVGEKDNIKINEDLRTGYKPEENIWNLDQASRKLVDAGFKIVEMKEEFPISRYYDVGALVYHLKAIPWQIEDFSVEKYYDKLKRIHKIIKKNGFYDVNAHRFFIIAEKVQ